MLPAFRERIVEKEYILFIAVSAKHWK